MMLAHCFKTKKQIKGKNQLMRASIVECGVCVCESVLMMKTMESSSLFMLLNKMKSIHTTSTFRDISHIFWSLSNHIITQNDNIYRWISAIIHLGLSSIVVGFISDRKNELLSESHFEQMARNGFWISQKPKKTTNNPLQNRIRFTLDQFYDKIYPFFLCHNSEEQSTLTACCSRINSYVRWFISCIGNVSVHLSLAREKMNST